MRAVRYRRFGPPDVLAVEDIDAPVPRAGELLVRVGAASLNPLDWKIRDGHLRFVPLLQRPPRGVGVEFAGEVVGTGGGAGPRHVGERVFGMLSPFGRQGTCAQLVVVRATIAVPIPPDVDDDTAATLPVAAGTAWQALHDEARVAAGQRVLITGAGGGVGHFAVQVAKHLGAQVVATCGAANVDFVRSLGADQVLDYSQPDYPSRIGAPVDVVLDAAESLGWRRATALLARGGSYIGTGGSAAAAVGATLAAPLAQLTAGVRSRTFVLRPHPTLHARLAALAASHVIVPHVSRRVALAGVAEAQAAMQTGHGRGKIVVHPHAR